MTNLPASRSGFWSRLSESERAALRAAAQELDFLPGQILIPQGRPVDQVMIIIRGWAKTTTVRADRKLIVLSVRGRHETIGESGWLSSRPHSANVQALERMKVLAIPVTHFDSFINAHPHAAVVFAEAMVDRWYESDQRMTAQIAATGPGRLAAVLIEFADRYGSPAATGDAISMTLPLNHTELAAMIGLCRESVARIFTTWRRQGIVSTERRWITIRVPSALREIADHPYPQ